MIDNKTRSGSFGFVIKNKGEIMSQEQMMKDELTKCKKLEQGIYVCEKIIKNRDEIIGLYKKNTEILEKISKNNDFIIERQEIHISRLEKQAEDYRNTIQRYKSGQSICMEEIVIRSRKLKIAEEILIFNNLTGCYVLKLDLQKGKI